jgi:hypothetical protein
MTRNDFLIQDEIQQLISLWEKAVFVSERKEDEFGYQLFQLNDFYIEKKYHPQFNICLSIKTFAA